MKTYITHPHEAEAVKEQILSALKKVSNIVCSTMGPGGRNVTIHSSTGIITTKDGVTVARYLNFDEPIENLIAMMAIDAAQKTVKEVGDGTTTSVLLVEAIYRNLVQVVRDNPHANLFQVCNGVDAAVRIIRDALHEMAIPIKDDEGIIIEHLLRDIAVISANNDEVLGRLIANAVIGVGENGTLDVRDSLDGSTYVEKMDGYVFPTLALRSFIPQGKSSATFDNPVFFIADYKFSNYDDIREVVSTWSQECIDKATGKLRPLVMIVSDIDGSALATMTLNASKMPIVVVKAPHFQGARMDMLNDIALLTQTRQVFSSLTGNTMERFGFGCPHNKDIEFGQALKFVLHKDRAEIIRAPVVGVGVMKEIIKQKEVEGEMILVKEYEKEVVSVDLDAIVSARIADLKASLKVMEGDGERRLVKERISRLSSGMGIVYVGADSELELAYKKMVIDDAIRACFTAIDGGITIGGGNALLKCYELLKLEVWPSEGSEDFDTTEDDDARRGMLAVLQSLSEPLRRITKNMFIELADTTIEDVVEADKLYGYSVMVNDMDDMFDAGIIDPVKVTESALKNAASVAKQLLLTEYFLLLEDVKDMDLGKLFYPEQR
jgi:chaperonin GroEL